MTMRWMLAAGIAAIAMMGAVPVVAQSTFNTRAAGVKVGGSVPMVCDTNGANCAPAGGANPLPVAGKVESAVLATANVPAGPVTLYGGLYVLNQTCSSYGTLSLRYRAADGVTMVTLMTKSAADISGTALQFGSGQVVDVALAGTADCAATLNRVP